MVWGEMNQANKENLAIVLEIAVLVILWQMWQLERKQLQGG